MPAKGLDVRYWRASGLRAHLRQLRTEFGMSWKQLGKESGWDSRTCRAWLEGLAEPSLSQVIAMACVFNHRVCLHDFREHKNHRKIVCEDRGAHDEAAELPVDTTATAG